MENAEQKSGVVATVLTLFMLLFLGGGLYYWNKTRSLNRDITGISERADSLLSEKLRLEGDIRSLSRDLESAKDENTSQDEQMNRVNQLLARKDQLMRALRSGNTAQRATVNNLNGQVAELTGLRDSLQNQLNAVATKTNTLTDEKARLLTQNQELQQQVAGLNSKLLTMVPRSSLTGDGFRVEVKKRNDSVTAKAKKAHSVEVSFSLPAGLSLEGMNELYLSVTDLQNNAIPGALRTETVNSPDNNRIVSVHAVKNVDFSKNPQRISFTLDPSPDLKPGTYRASIFTKDNYLGAVEFQLRDSFLFF